MPSLPATGKWWAAGDEQSALLAAVASCGGQPAVCSKQPHAATNGCTAHAMCTHSMASGFPDRMLATGPVGCAGPWLVPRSNLWTANWRACPSTAQKGATTWERCRPPPTLRLATGGWNGELGAAHAVVAAGVRHVMRLPALALPQAPWAGLVTMPNR